MKIGYLNRKTFIIAAVSVVALCSLLVLGILDGTSWKQPSSGGTAQPKATAKSDGEGVFPEDLNTYMISATYDEHKKQLGGTVAVDFRNTTGQTLEELWFCLYPNAFAQEANNGNVIPPELKDRAYPNGFSAGSITVTDIKVNEKSVTPAYEKDSQLMGVPLEKLKNNKSVMVSMEVTVQLPDTPMRFGYGEDTVNLCNWYPVLCVFDENGWNKCLYNANGDPFYSEAADYQVELTLPYSCKLAATGVIQSKNTDNPLMTVWRVTADAVRDFAAVFSPNFQLKSRLVGETIVYSYYLGEEEWGNKALQYGVDALKTYNSMYGEYPYHQLSVVASDFFIGGMEYPNLVMINKDLYCKDGQAGLEEVTVHEVAHQWWYGMVGNDEINEAWLDEGLTHYSTMLYYEKTYGEETFENKLAESEQYYKTVMANMTDKLGEVSQEIDRPAYDFEDWRLYDALTYDKTAMMFHTLRQTLGDEDFFASLRLYFEQNQFKNADRQALIKAIKEKSGIDVSSVMASWLEGKVVRPAA